jgi:hypothetical protein
MSSIPIQYAFSVLMEAIIESTDTKKEAEFIRKELEQYDDMPLTRTEKLRNIAGEMDDIAAQWDDVAETFGAIVVDQVRAGLAGTAA